MNVTSFHPAPPSTQPQHPPTVPRPPPASRMLNVPLHCTVSQLSFAASPTSITLNCQNNWMMEEFRNILMKNQFSSDEHNVGVEHLIKSSFKVWHDMSSVQEQLNIATMLSCARLSPPPGWWWRCWGWWRRPACWCCSPCSYSHSGRAWQGHKGGNRARERSQNTVWWGTCDSMFKTYRILMSMRKQTFISTVFCFQGMDRADWNYRYD